MGSGVVKNIFLAETQNGIHDVNNVTRALRIIFHDVYIRPAGLKELINYLILMKESTQKQLLIGVLQLF